MPKLVSVETPDGCIHTPVPVSPPEYRTGLIPVPTLIAMSRRENELRFSEEVQLHFKAQYAKASRGEPAFETDILEDKQRQVLVEFGFSHDDELRLYELRTAAMQHPDVPELQEAVYIKFNLCGDCLIENGEAAQNVILHDPTTLVGTSLFDVLHRDPSDKRLLFVVTGSYTLPPFRALASQFLALAHQYTTQVRFAFVYVQEAHAFDEWRMGQPKDILQHKTLEDRAAACQMTTEELGLNELFEVYLDSMSFGCGNPKHGSRCGKQRNFERVYGGWPLRYLLFQPASSASASPVMVWKAMPKGDTIPMEDVEEALDAACGRS